jgi:hypothetical protein
MLLSREKLDAVKAFGSHEFASVFYGCEFPHGTTFRENGRIIDYPLWADYFAARGFKLASNTGGFSFSLQCPVDINALVALESSERLCSVKTILSQHVSVPDFFVLSTVRSRQAIGVRCRGTLHVHIATSYVHHHSCSV